MKTTNKAYQTEVDLRHRPDGTVSTLTPVTWQVYYGFDDLTVTVPIGFWHDGASVPRIFWFIASPMSGVIVLAAVLHDWLYTYHKYDQRTCTRWEADKVFREAMKVSQRWQREHRIGWWVRLATPVIHFFQRWACWSGVRVGGYPSWVT